MTKAIILSTVAGILLGYFVLPAEFISVSEPILIISLCILLFFVGMDLGHDGNIVPSIKKVGFKVFLIPMAIIIGTLTAATLVSFLLPISLKETLAVAAGFGWYSYTPILLAEYSQELSAISFLHNVMRELFGLMLIPVICKYIGYIEAIGPPGTATGDVAIPIIEREAGTGLVIYCVATGITVTLSVPILVPIIMSF
ncbi:MAG: lysine exporter LysO family protein [Anaerovoracaceae bacterium]